jgi:hypothetical protein
MRASERYWLLQFDGGELRFTYRGPAERWASRLAERGTPSQLTWHDENTADGTEAGKQVA